jgi:N-methylhydantoinase A
VVTVRVRARGRRDKPGFQKIEISAGPSCDRAVLGCRHAIFEGRKQETVLLERDKLQCGHEIKGPALIVEYSSTIVIPPFASGTVDEYGNIVMQILPREVP